MIDIIFISFFIIQCIGKVLYFVYDRLWIVIVADFSFFGRFITPTSVWKGFNCMFRRVGVEFWYLPIGWFYYQYIFDVLIQYYLTNCWIKILITFIICLVVLLNFHDHLYIILINLLISHDRLIIFSIFPSLIAN